MIRARSCRIRRSRSQSAVTVPPPSLNYAASPAFWTMLLLTRRCRGWSPTDRKRVGRAGGHLRRAGRRSPGGLGQSRHRRTRSRHQRQVSVVHRSGWCRPGRCAQRQAVCRTNIHVRVRVLPANAFIDHGPEGTGEPGALELWPDNAGSVRNEVAPVQRARCMDTTVLGAKGHRGHKCGPVPVATSPGPKP